MPLGGVAHRPARREPRRPADQDRRQPRSPGQPRRDRPVRAGRRCSTSTIRIARRRSRNLGEIRPWSRVRRARCARRSTAQRPLQGRRPSHPHRDGHARRRWRRRSQELLARYPAGEVASSGSRSAATTRARAPRWPSASTSTRSYRLEQADVILSLDADFLGAAARRSLRYARAVRVAPPRPKAAPTA